MTTEDWTKKEGPLGTIWERVEGDLHSTIYALASTPSDFKWSTTNVETMTPVDQGASNFLAEAIADADESLTEKLDE